MEQRFDLIVIGSGPGGYVAAIKAAQLGMRTALMESREIGGTCLNRGCIPTKTMMHSSDMLREAGSMKEAGIEFIGLSFDYNRIKEHTKEAVGRIRQGIEGLLSANGVTILSGTAAIMGESRMNGQEDSYSIEKRVIRVSLMQPGGTGTTDYYADKVLIASGSKPIIPRIEGVHHDNVVTSDELLSGDGKLYHKLLIIGGGVIGVEFASIYQDFGCEVEIVEAMDRILPNMDREISQSVAMSFRKRGIAIHTGSLITGITKNVDGKLVCEYTEAGKAGTDGAVGAPDMTGAADAGRSAGIRKTVQADGILISVGRKANTDGLFGESFSPEMDGSFIKVNESFETSIPGIYAIGDVIRGKQLAHAASAQAVAAVERMCGREISVDLSTIPSCIYTSPEIAVTGMDEAEAKEKGYAVRIGKYPMLGNSKTILSMGERGFIKVVCEEGTGRILGAQLFCNRATDIISEFTAAIIKGLTVKDLSTVIRPHPTYSEGVTEAAEDAMGMAIHLMPKRR